MLIDPSFGGAIVIDYGVCKAVAADDGNGSATV